MIANSPIVHFFSVTGRQATPEGLEETLVDATRDCKNIEEMKVTTIDLYFSIMFLRCCLFRSHSD